MINFAIRFVTLAMFLASLVAAPPVISAFAAGGGGGGGGGGGDGGCGAVAPLSPDPPPPHPARCSNPATSPATMRRLPEISGGSVIGPCPRLALPTLRAPGKLPD